jgi:hypothetical protein
MEPNSKGFSCPSTASPLLPQATSEKELFKNLDVFLDSMLFPYRDAPSAFRESLAVRLRERVITTLAEADYDNTLRERVLKKERLRRAGENYEDGDSDDQSNDTAWTGADEEGGAEESGAEESGDDDMNTKKDGEEDDGLPSYSVEDPASENGNRVSLQQNTISSALSQASVILGVDGKKIMIAKEAACSPYDPSTLEFSRLCVSKSRKRSASSVSNFSQTLDGGMDIDPDEDSLVDKRAPVKMGIMGEQSTGSGARGPARKKSKS